MYMYLLSIDQMQKRNNTTLFQYPFEKIIETGKMDTHIVTWQTTFLAWTSIKKCFVCLMVFNNISVISWWSVLLVEETGGPGENHRPVANHWQMLYTSHWPRFELAPSVVMGTYCIGSCKSNYHTITVTVAPAKILMPFM